MALMPTCTVSRWGMVSNLVPCGRGVHEQLHDRVQGRMLALCAAGPAKGARGTGWALAL